MTDHYSAAIIIIILMVISNLLSFFHRKIINRILQNLKDIVEINKEHEDCVYLEMHNIKRYKKYIEIFDDNVNELKKGCKNEN